MIFPKNFFSILEWVQELLQIMRDYYNRDNLTDKEDSY